MVPVSAITSKGRELQRVTIALLLIYLKENAIKVVCQVPKKLYTRQSFSDINSYGFPRNIVKPLKLNRIYPFYVDVIALNHSIMWMVLMMSIATQRRLIGNALAVNEKAP